MLYDRVQLLHTATHFEVELSTPGSSTPPSHYQTPAQHPLQVEPYMHCCCPRTATWHRSPTCMHMQQRVQALPHDAPKHVQSTTCNCAWCGAAPSHQRQLHANACMIRSAPINNAAALHQCVVPRSAERNACVARMRTSAVSRQYVSLTAHKVSAGGASAPPAAATDAEATAPVTQCCTMLLIPHNHQQHCPDPESTAGLHP